MSESRLTARQEKMGYPVRFPPEQICFQHILQRADGLAKSASTHALIIADNRSDRERHRDHFATYQTHGTPGVYMRTTLDALLDTVHFAPTDRSRMLQAADVLAFIYRRFQTVVESDPRAAKSMNDLWSTLATSGKIRDPGYWP